MDRLTHRSVERNDLARFDRSGKGTPLSTILEMIGSGGRFLCLSFDGQREGKSKYLDFLRSVKVAVWAVVLAVRHDIELLDQLEALCLVQGLLGWLINDKRSGVEGIKFRSRVPNPEGSIE